MTADGRPCFAVDIDNVLGRAEAEVQRLFQELTGTSWPVGRYGSAGGLDTSQLDRSLIEEIFTRFHLASIPRLPVFPGARHALRVINRRYRVIIVTARRDYSRPQTLRWLQVHGIPFDALYHAEEKTEIPETITMAIDDHPHHIRGYCESGIRVLVMDQPWNRDVPAVEATRVTGWDAVLQWFHVRHISSWSAKRAEYVPPTSLFSSLTRSAMTPR